ncbi:hypothetical protein TNCV_2986671 [Trichonephila clavipes]|nr:hypothetical protein TNCV_2986671 [Trichonephila clavipes]
MARSRCEMSSWVHGNKFSRRCSADRDSDPRITVRSVAHDGLSSSLPHRGAMSIEVTEQNKRSWQLTD